MAASVLLPVGAQPALLKHVVDMSAALRPGTVRRVFMCARFSQYICVRMGACGRECMCLRDGGCVRALARLARSSTVRRGIA